VWKGCVTAGSLLGGIWLSLNIFFTIPPPELNPSIDPYLLKLAYRGGIGILLGLVLLFLSVWIATSIPYKQRADVHRPLLVLSIKYVVPIVLVWLVYLLAFYPGMMSADSMDQWGQVLSGRFVDHHPAFHTFLIWLLTRLYFSPTVVAIAQIISLAIVAGLWFAFFESLGIRRWLIWITALVFAVIPVNGTMVNTLWKDIPYSTAVLGLTLIVALVVFTKGKWIESIASQIILGLTAALVLLLRHDGLLLGAGTLVILFIAYPRKWKPWLVAGAICAFLYLGMRGPVYRWVGVQKPDTYTSESLSLYSIASYSAPGSETAGLVSRIKLTSPDWNCSIWTEITPDMLRKDIDLSISPTRLLGNFIQRMPNLLSYYVRCARSMEWIVWDPNGEVRNASHVEALVDQNPYGLKFNTQLPALQAWIADWVYTTSHDTNLNWFIWRPAIFMYLNLFLSAVLIIRNRSIRFGLLSMPILLQSITFSLILAEPNFRYHYAVYLVSLISIPLFISSPVADTDDQASGSNP
jgi:hypothetical protein